MSWKKKWQPTPVFLPGQSHGQRCLMGYSPWGRKRVRHDWAINTALLQRGKWIPSRGRIVCILSVYYFKRRRYSLFNIAASEAAAKSLQLCPTLWDPIDGSPPGSPVPGILQARTLEWVAISFSNTWKWKVKVKSLSHVRLFATPWTAAYQAPPSMGFSRQEHWSAVPLPSPLVLLMTCK